MSLLAHADGCRYEMAFIGAGKMAEALIGGIIKARVVSADKVVMSDVNPERLAEMRGRYDVDVTPDNSAASSSARCVLFAVKPSQMPGALSSVSHSAALYISIAAGVKTSAMLAILGSGAKVFRVMPNLPVVVGCGASVACGNGGAEDFEAVGKLFAPVGLIEFVSEEQIDAFTALSGSGPAFVAFFTEALISGAQKLGIGSEAARKFAVQTVFGAAKMMADGDVAPSVLREMVSSPGGTTLAGLARLGGSGFDLMIENALAAAKERSRQLSAAAEKKGKK